MREEKIIAAVRHSDRLEPGKMRAEERVRIAEETGVELSDVNAVLKIFFPFVSFLSSPPFCTGFEKIRTHARDAQMAAPTVP